MTPARGYKIEIGVGEPAYAEPVLSVHKEIFRQASLLDLDEDVMREVQSLYDVVRMNGLTKYKQDDKIVTALIYVVCRKNMIPLTLHKMCDILRIEYRSINKVYRYVIKRMSMHIPPTTPAEYAQKFGIELRLPKATMKRADAIIEMVKRIGLSSGKGPAGVAAASICLAIGLGKTEPPQKEIAEISGVTQVTIRNRYRELEECLNGKLKRLAVAQ